MTSHQKWTSVVVLVLIIAGLVRWSGQQRTNEDTIRIGVVASLTGPGSFYGENIRAGAELAAHEINQAGGVKGQPLEIIFEDDATNPKQTVSAARKLIDVDEVLAIVGVQWDFLANAAAPVAQEKETVIISAAAPFDSIREENQNPYMFTTFPSASGATEEITSFFGREQVTTAAIVATNNDWGSAYTRTYQQAAESAGIVVTEVIRLPEVDNNDLRTPLAKLRQAAPDAILTSINNADNINFVTRYRELGLSSAMLMHENFGDGVNTERISNDAASDFYFFEYADPTETFVSTYVDQHGEHPQIAADTAYDAVHVLAQALAVGGVSREGVRAGLQSVAEYHGASGLIDFTETNYPEDKKAVLRQVTTNSVINVE